MELKFTEKRSVRTIYIFLFCVIFNLNAQDPKYRWVHLEKSRLDRGKCFELDPSVEINNLKEEEITNYFKRVKTELCRPSELLIFFNFEDGKCYQGDKKTNGRVFIEKIKIDLCKPKATQFEYKNINNKLNCFEVDSETLGKNYFKKTKPNNCINEKSKFIWERQSIKRGTCYDISSGSKVKVKYDRCRPNNPIHSFIKKDFFNGDCIEHSINEKDPYSKKVRSSKCKPEKTTFFFYKKPGRTSGKCYEVDEKTRGEKYINKVEHGMCK
jgi:hypothetical protein